MRILLFLAVYLAVYGGINFYFWYRLKSAFGGVISIASAIVLVLLVAAPVLSRIADAHQLRLPARLLALFGMNWMGIVLLFLFYAFVCRIVLFGLQLLKLGFASENQIMFFAPLVLALFSAIYGRAEVERIRIKNFVIETPKEWKVKDNLRIVHISDLHLGLMAHEKRAQKIKTLLHSLEPDILVLTGDAIDAATGLTLRLKRTLQQFPSKKGKLAVSGNHEFYVGISKSLQFIKECGFKVLQNERTEIDGVCFVGVDDEMAQVAGDTSALTQTPRLLNNCNSQLKILLKHRPDLPRNLSGKFNLMLCGHTHGGQIFPFSLITAISYKFYRGLYKIADNSFVYVNSGTGTWGPQIRFFAPPEIAVFEIKEGSKFSVYKK